MARNPAITQVSHADPRGRWFEMENAVPRHIDAVMDDLGYGPRKPVSQMTQEERFQEIAVLLAIGAINLCRAEDAEARRKKSPAPLPSRAEVWDLVDDELEKQILRYLQQHVSAEPAQIRTALGISEMTLVRRLARLRGLGLVRVSGKTRNARYELATEGGRN